MKVKGLKGETVSGRNRYLTSIEIAKKYFKGNKNIVVVTGNVLAATLASTEPMPIFLSDINGGNEEVYSYIKENKSSKVYIIGEKIQYRKA